MPATQPRARYPKLFEPDSSLVVFLSIMGGVVILLLLLATSESTHSHDEIGHYLISRDAWYYPILMADVWGRPLHTLMYMIPAKLGGLSGVRIWSILLSLVTVMLTLDVAKKFNIRFWYWAPFFLMVQPWFMELGFLGITQIPFMVLMVASVWFHLNKHYRTAGFVAGLLPLIRYEGIALSALWMVHEAYHKRWLSVASILLPILILNSAIYFFTGEWLFTVFLDAKPNNIYPSGTWYHFLIRLPHPEAVGIPIILLAAAGLKRIWQSNELGRISIWYIGYLLLHTVLFRFGLFASGGYKFFLLPLAPGFAILAAIGLEQITTWFQKRKTNEVIVNAIYLLLLAASLGWTLVFVRPHNPDSEFKAMKKAAHFVRTYGQQNTTIYATHVYFYYLLPLKIDPDHLWEKHPPLKNMKEGSIIIWDGHYAERWGLPLDSLQQRNNTWKKLAEFEGGFCQIYIKENG